ncbi:hypothetical protein [Nocardioides sp.]|uniref:hypothetical protein n=1 Tax=Nocardioides sp. TaxID=35761 RepID=UPI002BEAEB77|nr:hypothetical protein [Nocardioides sp.]HSX68859.1 hypothetical protein [Nocardioides sp.]
MENSFISRRLGVTLAVALGLAGALALQVMLMGQGGGAAISIPVADLATQLGISAAAATKLMDYFGSWYFTILLAAATGGWGAGLVAIAKSMAVKYGKKAAAAW